MNAVPAMSITEIQTTTNTQTDTRQVSTPAGARRSVLAAIARQTNIDTVSRTRAEQQAKAWDGRGPLTLPLHHEVENNRTAVTVVAR